MGAVRDRKVLVTVGVVVAVALLAGVVWAASRAGDGDRTALGELSESVAPSDQTGESGQTEDGDAAPSRPEASDSDQGSESDSPGDSSDREPAPTSPAPSGAKLERVTSPPDRSVWALSADSYDADQTLMVEFQPYGTGPDSFGSSVVVLVTSSAASQDSSGRVPDLVGRNAVFILGGAEVGVGGKYTGFVTTKLQEDRIVMVLERATLDGGGSNE